MTQFIWYADFWCFPAFKVFILLLSFYFSFKIAPLLWFVGFSVRVMVNKCVPLAPFSECIKRCSDIEAECPCAKKQIIDSLEEMEIIWVFIHFSVSVPGLDWVECPSQSGKEDEQFYLEQVTMSLQAELLDSEDCRIVARPLHLYS